MITIPVCSLYAGFAYFDVFFGAYLSEKCTPCQKNNKNIPICISPSVTADISVSSPCVSENDAGAKICLPLCASKFLLSHRGLPLEEIEVEYGEEVYNLISTNGNGETGILTEKCKELYTKKRIFVDNIEIFITEYLFGNMTVRLFEGSESTVASDGLLRKLLYRDNVGICDISAGCSFSEGRVFIKTAVNTKKTAFVTLAAALCTATHLFNLGESSSIKVVSDMGEMKFEEKESRILCIV